MIYSCLDEWASDLSEAAMASTNDRIFNDDLLANDGDLAKAREHYPALEHVLHHPELIAYFKHYNTRADAAKTTSRLWGKWAIVLGAVAIALAAVEIASWALGSKMWPLLIGSFAATCGLASVAIGALSVLLGPRKRDWLHNRFMGERIRQFHFQSLIARLPQILVSVPGEGQAATDLHDKFKEDRQHLLQRFKDQFEGHVGARFTSAIGPHGEKDWWLHAPDEPPCPPAQRPGLDLLFSAYRDLRIGHQLGYANYKLQSDHEIFSAMPVRQAEVLEALSKVGIAWLVLIHAAVLAVIVYEVTTHALGDAEKIVSIVFCLGIIVVAVVALAVRVFQQGLQPEREIERYQQYRSAVQNILEQFDAAGPPAEKVKVMRRMEQIVFDEMRNFLITNERASFAL